MDHLSILPTIGLGKIKFLISIDEFKGLVGKPDDEELIREKIGELNSKILHYDSIGLSASFDEERDWKLTSLTVNNENFQLDGNYLFHISKHTFLKVSKTLNLGHYISDVFKDKEYTSTTFFFEEKNISFWFENDELQEIQWGII